MKQEMNIRKDKDRPVNVKGLKTCSCGAACDIDNDDCDGDVRGQDRHVPDEKNDPDTFFVIHRCSFHAALYQKDKTEGKKKFPF